MSGASRAFVIVLVVYASVTERAAAQDALVESPALAYATSTDTIQAASAIPGLSRGSIDVDVLMAVIRERAQRAALNALIALFEEATSTELRAYERRLLDAAVALLSRDAVSSRQIESLLMIVARVGLASLIVEARFRNDAAAGWEAIGARPPQGSDAGLVRRYLVDWAYWWLGESPLFRQDAEAGPPRCPEAWNDAPLCATLGAGAPVTNAETLLGARTFLAGLRAVERIYAMASDRALDGALFPSDLIEALRQAELVADFQSTAGLRFAEWREVFLTDAISGQIRLFLETTRTMRSLKETIVAYNASVTVGRPSLAQLGAAKDMVLPIRMAIERGAIPLGEMDAPVRALLANVESTHAPAAITVPPELLDATLRPLLGPDGPLRADVVQYAEAAEDAVDKILERARRIEERIRAAGSCDGLRIECVSLSDLRAVVGFVDTIYVELTALGRATGTLGFLTGEPRELLELAVDRVRRLQAFLKLAVEFAQGTGGVQLSEVLATIRRLDREVLAAIEPVLGVVRFDRPVDPADVAMLLLHVPSAEVASALGIDTSTCEHGAPSPQCLLLAIHDTFRDSLEVDGETIRVDSEVVVDRFVSISEELLTDRSGGWFFHLAIGAGALFTQPVHYRQETRTDGTTATVIAEGEWRFTPLVAEQIGIGLRTARLGAFVVKGGLFASGILYRILVDSAESEAFVGGLFVALDVDDDIEFYLAGSGLVYPPEGEADATVRFGVSAGVQIPLSAYLEAL